MDGSTLNTVWTKADIAALFDAPLADLILKAQAALRAHFKANTVQLSQLLSVKTGGCPEDCGYCAQSASFDTGLKASKLMAVDAVLAAAETAKASGAQRFCMGAAWRGLKDRDMDAVCAMISGVKAMGLETCVTLGLLDDGQAEQLRDAGLDYYNHNLDTSPEYYDQVITTRTYQDRLETLSRVAQAGVKVCCGGIMGLGESREDRVSFVHALAGLPQPPQSVPINRLHAVKGTRLGEAEPIDDLEFVRVIAVTRIVLPQTVVRLSAGRDSMSDAMQALCFLAGANSVFLGETLLTVDNPETDADARLFQALGLVATPEAEMAH